MTLDEIANYADLIGAATVMVGVMWRKLDGWLDSLRAEQPQPSWAEWFQWLAQVSARHKDETRPAYVA